MDDWFRSLPPAWLEGCEPRVFEVARAAYETPGRHYHTWSHVKHCLGTLREFPPDSPRPVFLALLFHDAVHVAGRPDNEELSAELAVATLAMSSSVPDAERSAVRRMIMATKDHRAPDGAPRDLRVVLDIDMSILGAEAAEYRRYAADVKREWVPAVTSESRFRIGRLAFLRKVSASTRIFSTGEGVARWEAAARRNIAAEIAELESSQGWVERALSRLLRR